METTPLLPIEYEEVIDVDYDDVTFENVVFKEDFGPWSKGERVHALTFNNETGKVYSTDEEGDTVDRIDVKLVPTTES